MAGKCLVEKMEGRDLDSYDLITVLGLLKEHDWKEICRRYGPGSHGRILNDNYVEMGFRR